MFTTRQCKDPEQVLQQAAIQLNTLFYSLKNKPVLFMISGGSALKALQFINYGNLGSNVTITVLDERFSKDPTINNFAQITALPFYQGAVTAQCNVIDTRYQEGDTLMVASKRWDAQLKAWAAANPDGQIIATLGVGPDGHTSGIMPYPEAELIFESLFCQPETWAVGYQAIGKNPYPDRITTTISFLKEKVNVGVGIAFGSDKKDALQKINADTGSMAQTPSRVIRDMSNVVLFTDIVLKSYNEV